MRNHQFWNDERRHGTCYICHHGKHDPIHTVEKCPAEEPGQPYWPYRSIHGYCNYQVGHSGPHSWEDPHYKRKVGIV